MTLDSWDLDMRNCVIGNLLITDLARAEPLDDVWSCELDGPKGNNHYTMRILKARLVLKIISGTSSTSNFIMANNTHARIECW